VDIETEAMPKLKRAKRVRFAPTVKPETIEMLDAIGDEAGDSRGEVLDRLVEREYKRLGLKT
jgi:hypothetical protein